MSIGVIIQARMASTRLPGKVFKEFCGKTALQHLVERIRHSKYTPQIIIATTINPIDDVLAEFSINSGLTLYRGSEQDVLSRYYFSAKENNIDIIVRITSDCPLYEYKLLDEMLDFFLKSNYSYISNCLKERTYPRGLDTEIFKFSALKKAFNEAKEQPCREHVTPYIYQNPDKFSVYSYTSTEDHSDLRWTLDTAEDYELIRRIYECLYPLKSNFGYEDILKAYKTHPEWREINRNIEQKKVGYKGV